MVPGRATSATAVVLYGGIVVASVFDGEKAFGFVAVTRCERPAVALGRGPSRDFAGGLSADSAQHCRHLHHDHHLRLQY